MKDIEGKINLYDTKEKALDTCGIYEFKDVWVSELVFNHKEPIDAYYLNFNDDDTDCF